MDLCVAAWSMCCGDSCINIAKFGRCAYARRPFCVTLIGFDGTWFYTDGRAVIKIGHTKISVPLIYNVLTFYLSEGTIYPVLVQSVFFCPKRKSEVQIYAQKINRQTADCSFPCSADGAHLLYCSAFCCFSTRRSSRPRIASISRSPALNKALFCSNQRGSSKPHTFPVQPPASQIAISPPSSYNTDTAPD